MQATTRRSGGRSQTLDAAREEAAIQTVLEGLDAAWNAHDAHAFAAWFTEDADFTNVRGMQTSGRERVEWFMAPLFETMFADSRQHVVRSRIRFVAADLAAADVWWTMDGARTVDGQVRPTRYGLFDLLLRKDRGGWRILVWQNMELAGPPPEDPSAWRFAVFHNDGPAEQPAVSSPDARRRQGSGRL